MTTPDISRRFRASAERALEIMLESIVTAEKTLGPVFAEVDDEDVYRPMVAEMLRAAALGELRARGLDTAENLRSARLFSDPRFRLPKALAAHDLVERARAEVLALFCRPSDSPDCLPDETLGSLYEVFVGEPRTRDARGSPLSDRASRKRQGRFYTPRALAAEVVGLALESLVAREVPLTRAGALDLRICDPALGGGVFLLETCRALANRCAGSDVSDPEALLRARRDIATTCLYGVDVDGLAVAVSELTLWFGVGDPELPVSAVGSHLREGNALLGASGAGGSVEGRSARVLDMWYSAALSEATAARRRSALERVETGTGVDSTGVDSTATARRLGVFHWPLEFPEVFARGGFDLVIGNPPWVAYAGRSAQPLAPSLRTHYRAAFSAMHGFPSLHGLFIERAAELAGSGHIALLVPSPVCDLDGYGRVRERLTQSHSVVEPLTEFGQDAFLGVTQPCAAVIAAPNAASSCSTASSGSTAPWSLLERQRAGLPAEELDVPELLRLLARATPLSRDTFREMGFQSSRLASERLFWRGQAPMGAFDYPLLEGRRVREFCQSPVCLFLDTDPERLKAAGCRVRPVEAYRAVEFVVRQTAKYPIASLHSGVPFRNTLLAGFGSDDLDAATLVGLLNSALYRALHMMARRDARQAAFPQVKIAHLRALPAPPHASRLLPRVRDLSLKAHCHMTPELRGALDDAVFDVFCAPADHRTQIRNLLARRASELGYELRASTPPVSGLQRVRDVIANVG